MTVVLYARTEGIDTESLIARWQRSLTPHEERRLATLRFAHDRRDYLAAHVLLRIALREVRGVESVAELPAERRGWSLTHANGLVACAVAADANASIGIDTEPRAAAKRLETIVDAFLTQNELALLPSDPNGRAIRMVEVWTSKEALLKALGEGFSGDEGFGVLAMLECTPLGKLDGWATISVRDARTGAAYSALGRWVEGYALTTVVIEGDEGIPRIEGVELQ